MVDFHSECLASMCRMCGNKLKKTKDKWKSSYSCIEFRDVLLKKFDLETEKDNELIHPLRFCNACYLSNSKTRATVFWEPHVDSSDEGAGECKTCSLACKIKKGGRPMKKGTQSRKKNQSASTSKAVQENQEEEFITRIQELSSHSRIIRPETFTDRFEFVDEVKEDFYCAICRDILSSPIETKCEHYFCAGCLRQVGLTSSSFSCPVCKESLSPIYLKQPTRMVLRLLGEIKVRCRTCNQESHYEDSGMHICTITENPTLRHVTPVPQPPPVPAQNLVSASDSLEQAMSELREGNISPEMEKLGTLFVKSKLRASNDGSALLKTGGKPLKLISVRQAEKPSDQVSERHVRNRTKDLQRVGATVSGNQMNVHVLKHLKSTAKAEREKLIRDALGKELILEVPEGEALAMKADIGLSWFRLNKLRWFGQWSIRMDSEKKQRVQKKRLIGDNLQAEFIPMEHHEKRGNKMVTIMKETPCAFVDDLEGKIIDYVESNNSADLLTWHGGLIPDDKLFVKLGGDHGQGSMKLAFQLANVEHPNSTKNTVVFALFEGKDTRNNLRTVTQRYSDHLEQLTQHTWHDKSILLFLFGDYEFLCKVMGISGASGRHPCIWCTILAAEMPLTKDQQSEVTIRTLEHLNNQLKQFQEKGQGNLKNAKKFFNVIHEPLFNIPIDQICVPGLHISLGVFLKFYELLLDDCLQHEQQIAANEAAETGGHSGNTEYDEYVKALHQSIQHQKAADDYTAEAQTAQDYVTYLVTVGGHEMSDTNPVVMQVLGHAHELRQKAKQMESLVSSMKSKLQLPKGAGRVSRALEDVLQKINVKRQAYHSNSFIGNHIDICLKTENIHKICKVIVDVTEEHCPILHVLNAAKTIQDKYQVLFSLFSTCHFKYNASHPMKDEDISVLDQDIKKLMVYYRSHFPRSTFPPKMHMLENHVTPFIRKWHFPLGFFGEQGGESIHHEFVSLANTFSRVKPATDRLKKMLEEHYVMTSTASREVIPQKPTRNLKRKHQE